MFKPTQESLDKTQLLYDVWDGKTPKRVPLVPFFGMNFALEYAGYAPQMNHISSTELLNAAECIAGEINCDIVPTVFLAFPRPPHSARETKAIRCFSDLPEYVEIAAKYHKAVVPVCGFAFIFPDERLLCEKSKRPKKRTANDPIMHTINELAQQSSYKGEQAVTKHDRITIFPKIPLFSDMTSFENEYWPTLQSFCEKMDETGYGISLILDHPWEQFSDHLLDLPAKTQMKFCAADPVAMKKKLGSKHILCGGYPTEYLRKFSKETCSDKAKELLDILAPGGGYLFSFNHIIDRYSDISMDRLETVLDTVMRYGNY